MRSINNTGDSILTRFANVGGFGGSVFNNVNSSNSNSDPPPPPSPSLYLTDENDVDLEDEAGLLLDDE